jgi:hypothetical protein
MRAAEFRCKGHYFRVEESLCGDTPNNNVWVLNRAKTNWDWKHLTNWDYDKLVRTLKRKGMDYLKD